MTKCSPFRYFKASPEIIRLAVMMYIRFPPSLRNVEDLLHERGIDICHETVRVWWHRSGPIFAAEIRKRRIQGGNRAIGSGTSTRCSSGSTARGTTSGRLSITKARCWRASSPRPGIEKAALKFLRKATRKHGRPAVIVTDRLPILWCCPEGSWRDRQAADWPVVEQPRGEFPSSVATTRKGDAPVQTDAKYADVYLGPRLRFQPLQPRTPSLQSGKLQEEPRCRSTRVAGTLCRVTGLYVEF